MLQTFATGEGDDPSRAVRDALWFDIAVEERPQDRGRGATNRAGRVDYADAPTAQAGARRGGAEHPPSCAASRRVRVERQCWLMG